MQKKPEVQPPFKWTGGKNRMWEAYLPIFFPKGKFDTFVDLFCGAGSVSLWIKENYPDVHIVMNDTNSELISMYKTIKNDYSEFESEYLKLVNEFVPLDKPNRKLMYQRIMRAYCLEPENNSETVNNAHLYFMLQTNFNGIWKGYKKWNGRYSTPPGTLTMKEHFFDVKRTRHFHNLLKDATITNLDFADVESNGGKTYWYADPPYRSSIVNYDGTFTDDDQVRLVNFLKSKSEQGDFISESNKEVGDKFWNTHYGDDYTINVVAARYTAGRGKTVKDVNEVLVTNL